EGKASRKRARTDLGSDIDDDDADANPYPLEGKYKDEEDRMRLNDMPEMEREQILAQRQDEMQSRNDKFNLSKLLAAQDLNGSMADDSVAQAAKRKRLLTGSAREKAHTRDALKANRKAKEERRAHHTVGDNQSSRARRRDSGSSDMDTGSDEPDEPSSKRDEVRKPNVEEKKLTVQDLNRIQLTRTQLAKECMKPWFGDYVRGTWVRYLIGSKDNQPVYRVCEVKALSPPSTSSSAIYEIEGEKCNQQLQLAFGHSVRFFNMDKVSNGPFTDREFNRLVITCKEEGIKLPTQAQVQRKREAIKAYESRTLTDADITSIVIRRKALHNPDGQSLQQRIAEGSRLRQEHATAKARGDKAEMHRLREELEAYNARYGLSNDNAANQSGSDTEGGGAAASRSSSANKGAVSAALASGDGMLLLEELSRRNRQANQEDARRIQILEAERRKKAQLEKIREAEAAKKRAADEGDSIESAIRNAKDNPDLVGKDIGTQMAHMVDIDLPDF
ncbi:hypothetical protein M408DRAFT_332883, partial [Serendipita vermifera MAFF 305830]